MTAQAQSEVNESYYHEFQVNLNNGKYGLLFRSDVVVPYEYDAIVAQRDNKLFISKQGDKYGIICVGVTHNIPLNCVENISQNWHFLVKKGVGRKNNIYLFASVIPCKFDKIDYTDGKVWVSKDNLKGVLNSAGGTILHCDYDEIKFTDGKYWVTEGGHKGVLNSAGGTILHCDYDKIEFTDGKYWVSKGGQKGVLNSAGGIILHCEYDKIEFTDGKYWVSKDKQKGILNSAGGIILRCEFDKIELTSDGKYIVYKDGKKSLYNSAGGRIQTDFDVIYSTE
jgi:hypothetical protein